MNTNILPQATINRYIVARHKTTYHYLCTSLNIFVISLYHHLYLILFPHTSLISVRLFTMSRQRWMDIQAQHCLWNVADTTHLLTLGPCFVVPTPHYFVHPPCLLQLTPLMQHAWVIAKTSCSHPLSPSPSKAMPSRKRKSPVKRKSPPKKTQKSDKATSRARKTLPTKSNRKNPPPETLPSQPDRKDPPGNIMPMLKPVAEVVPRYSFRTNRTPAPSPPRVLRLPPINPYHPLDHTSDAHPAPLLELLTHVAAAVVDKRGKSADECSIPSFRSRQSSEEWIVGQKGSPGADGDKISDDDDDNSSVGTDTDDRSSNDKAYDKTAADDLYYSDDDFLGEDFYREIDDLARTIEYLDPKKVKCGRCWTTLIQGEPQPPK